METGPRHPPEVLESKSLHQGRIFELVHERIRLPSGLEQELDLVRHSGAVCVAARTSEGELVCVRQYRHAVGREVAITERRLLRHLEDRFEAAGFRYRDLLREIVLSEGFRTASPVVPDEPATETQARGESAAEKST